MPDDATTSSCTGNVMIDCTGTYVNQSSSSVDISATGPPPCREPAGAGAGAGGRGAASFGENLPHAEQHRAQQVEAQMQQEAEEAVVVLGMKLKSEINQIL